MEVLYIVDEALFLFFSVLFSSLLLSCLCSLGVCRLYYIFGGRFLFHLLYILS